MILRGFDLAAMLMDLMYSDCINACMDELVCFV